MIGKYFYPGQFSRRWFKLGAAVVCIWLGTAAWAGEEQEMGKAAFVFDQAIQSYLKGDSQGAIQLLDESLRLEPDNPRAKVFLLKILVERGSRLFLAKQYQKAYDFLSRAYNMDPNNQQVRQMFDLAAKQINPPKPVTQVMLIPKEMQTEVLKAEARQHAQEQGAPEAAVPGRRKAIPAAAVYTEPAPMEMAASQTGGGVQANTSFLEQYAKNATAMMNLLAGFQQRQEQQLSQFMMPLERIQQMYYKSEEDRKNFINQLDNRFKSVLGDISFQQRLVIYGFSIGLGLLSVIVWGFFIIVGRLRSRREEIIMKYQQEMLKMVRDMAGLPGASGYAGMLPGGYGNPMRLAAAPVQYLPTAAPATMPMDEVNGQECGQVLKLEQMTQVGNYKERALAAMQMLSVDAERAANILKTMAFSNDAFQRENTLFALGEKYHPLTLDLIINGLQDPEQRVSAAAVRALRRLNQNNQDISEEAKAQIQTVLQNLDANDRRKGKKA